MSTSIAQVARLLSEIPYIEANPGVTLQQVAQVFSTTAAQVRKDISVAIFCGLPGGYPSDLIDVDLDVLDDEGTLYLTNPTSLARPLRLTVMEAASLQLALLAVRPLVPDATARLIDALMDKIALPASQSVELHLVAGDDAVRETIDQAIAQADRLELVYHGRARGETTHPLVDPVEVYVMDAVVYLSAYCVTSGGWRTYRLDRIAEARATGAGAESHGPRPVADSWAETLAQASVVHLAVSDEAAWIGEYYPTREVTRSASGTAVTLSVVEPSWLVRLLLSLGDQVRRVDPPDVAQIARDLARTTLEEYARLVDSPPGRDL